MVNMLVVGSHVMVPKPFGPRVAVADAVRILRDRIGLSGVNSGRLAGLVGHYHWADQGDSLADIVAAFGVAEATVRGHARNAGLAGVLDTAGEFTAWRRVWIPEDNVDILEAYVQVVLEDNGIQAHFVDDWDSYHAMDGEVHCGTNARRTPPEQASGYGGPYWWERYEEFL